MKITIPWDNQTQSAWKPEPHQLEVMRNKARFRVVIWHRKARKTTFAIQELIRRAAAKPGLYWIVFPFFSQAKRTIWEDPEMLPRYLPPGWTINNTEAKIMAPNGSVIRLIGADNRESLRGPGLKYVIFDEFDDIDLDTWHSVIRPMLVLTGGKAMFMGSPKGTQHLYSLYDKCESGRDKEWWAAPILRVTESNLLPENEVKSLQEDVKVGDMPQLTWECEYMCSRAAAASGVFRRIKENIWDGNLKIKSDRKYQIGVDIAKLSDWTVITPIDLHDWKIGIPERFQHLDYPLIEARIEANWLKYNKAKLIIENNSIGEPVIDHLIHDKKITYIEPFLTTERSKEAIIKNLSILLETDQIKIPNYEPLIREMKVMRYERNNKSKKLKIVSPDGYHDDCVMSLAFTCWNLPRLPLKRPDTWIAKEFQKFKKATGQKKSIVSRI